MFKKSLGCFICSILAGTMLLPQTILANTKTDEPLKDTTSTEPVLHDSFREFSAQIKDNEFLYKDGIETFKGETGHGTYVIPGLIKTLTLEDDKPSTCTDAVPQGLAVTDDYVVISAYCKKHEHNSVLYVLDKSTHKYIKTVVLDNKNHVGGLGYNPETNILWVATKKDYIAAASSLKISDIESYDFLTTKKAIKYDHSVKTTTMNEDSYLTCHDNKLYLGTFTLSGDSKIETFDISKPGKMASKPEATQEISDWSQGIAFYKDYILLSDSDGHSESKLRIFKANEKKLLDKDELSSITLPERLEQVAIDGDKAYLIFESAAKAYSNEDSTKLDRVITVDLKKVKFE